ncbi:MAG: ribonuclease R [Patescibacteria group bacterium]|nr:ribonuclease R [Patescibacteria group bacterium]
MQKEKTNRPPRQARVSGIVQITRKGTGYVAWPEHEDIEIATEALGGALNGDEVEVEVIELRPGRGKGLRAPLRPHGKIIRVISRARDTFVCTLKRNGRQWVALPDDVRFYRPILLKDSGTGKEGEKILVELISFNGVEDPQGKVLQALGRAGEHRTEMNAIVLEHGFSTQFLPEVVREAQQIEKDHTHIIAEEASKRFDCRTIPTFTIDPPDAKDFDDALSVQELGNGEFEIGIHIADASFFVKEGSALDAEARKRGTSVYLVDTTIPMVPNELSGNVCSLREGEDRLAFSAIFRLNQKAEVLDRQFKKTIIRSDKRFTYEAAQEVLTKKAGPYFKELEILRSLGRTLKREREREGAIDFGENEVRFTLDEHGRPLAITRKERLETNSLIEEFMLLANREVAQYVSKLAQKNPEHGLVFLYRIHDQPKEDRIEELAVFVRALGYEFGHVKKGRAHYSARDIQVLLDSIEGKPEEQLIRTATLRSMAKAIYSTKNIGHFGLSFEYYTHFTSPIRRYPDILVHRILGSHLNNKPITHKEYGALEKMCIAASLQEAKATDAERDSIRYKQVEFMTSKIGEIFEGTVSGTTEWGVYVEEKHTACEGLVRVASIEGDYYRYNPKEYAIVGDRTNKKIALGDRVRVKLVGADVSARTIDFVLV